MRAFVAEELHGIDSLKLAEVPKPRPMGPSQIRVALRAASINFRDLLVLGGALRSVTLPKLIPCSDGAGEVMEVGADVWRVKPGDRVALTFNPDWIGGPWQPSPGAAGRGSAVQGVMCDEVVVAQHEAVVLPEHFSFAEGAALPCAGVTAWHSLCGTGALLPGMNVLLQGGGGVSLFALQFAKLFGARVIMLSSSPERCARLKELGADETIDYHKQPEWSDVVRDLTRGLGVDLTIEVVGAETFNRSLAATRAGGRLAMVGLLTGRPHSAAMVGSSGVEITPIRVGSRLDFEAMNRAMEFHAIHPVIDSHFRFEQLPDALRHLKTGRQLGKVVIDF